MTDKKIVDIDPHLWEKRYRELDNTFKGVENELKSTRILLEARKREVEDFRKELQVAKSVGKMVADVYNSLENIFGQVMTSQILLSQALANHSYKETEGGECTKQSET